MKLTVTEGKSGRTPTLLVCVQTPKEQKSKMVHGS